MSLDCPPAELLLRLSEPDLFDDPQEAREVAERAEGCPDCQALLAQFEAELAPPPLPFDPQELLPELRALMVARATPAPLAKIEVRLLCGYCKDGLQTTDALYCASCLTPHHGECYAEHGRCVAPGCESQAVVGAREATQLPPRPRRLWSAALGALGLVALGGVAAWAPDALSPDPVVSTAPSGRQPTAPAAASPAPAQEQEGYTLATYAVGDLVKTFKAKPPAWKERYQRRLEAQPVTLNFPKTPLSEVVNFLRDITGLNLTLAPGLDLEREVSLRLRNTTLASALDLIAEQSGLRWSLIHGTVYLQPVVQGHRTLEPVDWPLEAAGIPQEGTALIASLREFTSQALGEAIWKAPAQLSVQRGVLRVTQTQAGHQAVVEFLASQRPLPTPAEFRDAWFGLRPPSGLPPAVAKARLHAHELLGEISLRVEGSMADACARLREVSATPIRVDPRAEAMISETQLELSLRGVTRRDALNLICAAAPSLVWEVDRNGVLIRPAQAPPLEARLARGARRAVDGVETRDLRKVLRSRSVSLNCKEQPGRVVIDFFRDISGLNFVVTPAARKAMNENTTLVVRGELLSEVLEDWLTPMGLGTDLSQGVVRIVPAHEASEGKALEARRAKLLATSIGDTDLRGVDLYALVAHLEAHLELSVHLDDELLGARQRVFLPAGTPLGEALEQIRLQAAFDSGLAWLPEEKRFVLALRRTTWANLGTCLELVAQECLWEDAPETILAAWRAQQAELQGSLELLSAANSRDLEARLKAALELGYATKGLNHAYHLLGTRTGREIRLSAAKRTAQLAAALRESGEAIRRVDLDRQALQAAEQESEAALLEHVATGELSEHSATKLRQARRAELASRSKDLALQLARLQSEVQVREDRLKRDCVLPGRIAEDAALAKRLAEGAAYSDLFPKGHWEFLQAASRLDWRRYRLGRRYAQPLAGGATFKDSQGRILPRERVVSAEGAATPTPLALAEALGRALEATPLGSEAELRVVVQRGPVQIPLRVKLKRAPD